MNFMITLGYFKLSPF